MRHRAWLLALAGLLLGEAGVSAQQRTKEMLARDLQEVARVATVMMDGDACERIMTPRALEKMFAVDPNDRWAGSDNFDVSHEPFVYIKKTLIRLARLLPYPADCNLWMPFKHDSKKIQILIRNRYEMSQFWAWGVLFQDQTPEMAEVLASGQPQTIAQKSDFVSVLTPVLNSLGDRVGLVEVVSRLQVDPQEHVKQTLESTNHEARNRASLVLSHSCCRSRKKGGTMSNPCSLKLRAAGYAALLVIGSAFTVWGKDFWEDKPFTSWNEQEAMRILSESPWARTQSAMVAALRTGQQSSSSRAKDLPSLRSANTNSGGALSQAGVSFSPGDSVALFVRWYSSVRIRQALARLGQLKQNAPEAEVRKFVEAPVEDYEIAVTGPVLDAFNELSLSDFQSKTFLTSKKNKGKKIALKNYTAPKDRKDGVALFSFSRTVEGNPALSPEDEEVEFVTQANKISLKASFKLAKMVNDGKLDL
jgi:hypothetical protein